MRKNLALYLLIVLGCVGGIYAALHAGKRLEATRATVAVNSPAGPADSTPPTRTQAPSTTIDSAIQALRGNLQEPLSLLLIQLILIILLARVFGSLLIRMGQPGVIGEMIAGIVLGPSVVGALFPGVFHFVFPATSFGALRMLSQVGVILFMFVVGMELDVNHLRTRAHTALMVSHTSIVFPYFLGVIFSLFIYQGYAPQKATFLSFALFMGIAMSITAFPVLARIIEERGLSKSYLGSMAITCAAVGDVTAWTILAFVVAVAKADGTAGTVLSMLTLVIFVAGMLLVIKPLLHRWLRSGVQSMGPSRTAIVAILILVFASGLFTEVIGMHALFGAFLAGVIMPADTRFRETLRERLESFSSSFLLPLFFAFTGLRTQIGLLNDWGGVIVCLGLIFIATLGKLGGTMFVARFTGMDWHDSFALGALMNTRGLVELIVLNIGFDLGILSPRVFAMTVIMALVTTFMTGPLLSLGNVLRRKTAPATAQSAAI
jgi:Kef-type K+ transport system membrane component KefB